MYNLLVPFFALQLIVFLLHIFYSLALLHTDFLKIWVEVIYVLLSIKYVWKFFHKITNCIFLIKDREIQIRNFLNEYKSVNKERSIRVSLFYFWVLRFLGNGKEYKNRILRV
ncbi:hypothetical protein Ahy_A04g017089 isoform C [Arachis hypogaea]|uniref:Uncharacterized protein n=1 Tax=Arachis hypogaea TaxID=3818 RepID=A0A445D9X9_ARAHY|nr:hypothetical protein Ahy_A04g017089 isoform C [Arachis hypogaea]